MFLTLSLEIALAVLQKKKKTSKIKNLDKGKKPSLEKSSQEWENFAFLCPFTVFQGNLAQVQQDCPLQEGRRKARAKLCSWQIRVFNKE